MTLTDEQIRDGLNNQVDPVREIRTDITFGSVTDMSDPADVLRESQRLYEQKDEDWADAWRSAGEMLWTLAGSSPISIDSPEDMISFALYWIRLVKMQRSFNGEFLSDEMNFEGVADSQEDGVCYAAMHRANSEVKSNAE